MFYVSKNPHRWKESLGNNMRSVLEDAGALLEWAWKLDTKYPDSYPLNTKHAFYEIKTRIAECQARGRSQANRRTVKLALLRPPPPQRLSDLVSDEIIRATYEEQNTGRYIDALKRARSGDKTATRIFQKILNAVESAYYIEHFGDDSAPKPRVHFLHRNLLEIADLSHLSDLTHEGVMEFIDDLCPCRKKHRPDAIRKLRQRRVGS